MLLLGAMLCLGNPAFAVYKCESGGTITYADTPCLEGKSTTLSTSSTGDPNEAQRRATSEKNSLKRLEKERHQREAADERGHKRAARASAAKQKQCTALASRQKRAFENVAATTGKANEKAKLKARHITEDYEATCGRWPERDLGFGR